MKKLIEYKSFHNNSYSNFDKLLCIVVINFIVGPLNQIEKKKKVDLFGMK